jgi:ABC-type Mn2+/Zn2+ transport system permease subunit
MDSILRYMFVFIINNIQKYKKRYLSGIVELTSFAVALRIIYLLKKKQRNIIKLKMKQFLFN